jgi:hypothetical protein
VPDETPVLRAAETDRDHAAEAFARHLREAHPEIPAVWCGECFSLNAPYQEAAWAAARGTEGGTVALSAIDGCSELTLTRRRGKWLLKIEAPDLRGEVAASQKAIVLAVAEAYMAMREEVRQP